MSAPKASDTTFANRYRVLRELGRGGMGTVDVAYQIDLGRDVALKRILPENVGRASAEAWFKREYKALAAIRHPGVPAIHDCGKDKLVSYFTMEIIDGHSLASVLRQRAFDAVEAITTAIDLARILAAAHAAGVIHRDVKPANILIEAGSRVRLIDFGICAFLPRFDGGRPDLRSVGENEYKTGPLEVAGSPGYTDPALFSGHPPCVQSDVFSVCVILYEMIAGRRLFDDRAGGFQQVDSGEFAPELAQIVGEIRRGSQLLPKDRHASMDELVRGLEIARSAVNRFRDAEKARMRLWLFRGLTAVNVIALIALCGFLIMERAAPAPAAAEEVVEPAVVTPETPSPVTMAIEIVKPAAASSQLQPDPRAVVSTPGDSPRLSPALVSETVRAASKKLGKCLKDPGMLNLEIMVRSGRPRLTRVEWVAYDAKDGTQRCLARALKAIEFPRDGSPGPYDLQIRK